MAFLPLGKSIKNYSHHGACVVLVKVVVLVAVGPAPAGDGQPLGSGTREVTGTLRYSFMRLV